MATVARLPAAAAPIAALALLCVPAGPGDAGARTVPRQTEERPGVTIEYIAHACFRVTSPQGHSVLIDPFASRVWIGYDFPAGVAGQAVLISHPHYDHDAGIYRGAVPPWDESTTVLREPGHYTVGDIQVTGVRGKHADPYGKEFGQINTLWLLEVGGLRIVHTGDNGPIDDRSQQQLGRVDVLMLPVDAQFHILSQAQIDAYRERLRPRILIPMHYRLDDLEPDPDKPGGLGNIDDWAAGQDRAHRVGSNRIALMAGDLPPEPRILIFEHSPAVLPPAPGSGR